MSGPIPVCNREEARFREALGRLQLVLRREDGGRAVEGQGDEGENQTV